MRFAMQYRVNSIALLTLLCSIGLCSSVAAQEERVYNEQAATGPAAARTTQAPATTQAPTAAQAPATTPAPTAAQAPATSDKPAFKQEELEQILAPIALYPDDLVSQILMASTYPIEIVQADRWAKANKALKGDAAAKALEKESWDPSVKSLVALPDLLAMLSEKLDWTQKLGDAFIGQQADVMRVIQQLRGKAKSEGKLDSNEHQKVEVSQEGTTQYITIESSNPNVIYVPVYDPVVVYGTWPYPAYPPYPYYPPAYGVGMGIAVGFAWGYAWGGCNWGHSDVDIDINRNTNINNNIDRGKYKQNTGAGGRGNFKHDPSHRQGVPYRNQASAKQYGGRTTNQAAQARESYRGRTDAGGANRASAGTMDRAGGGAGSGGLDRASAGGGSASNRAQSSGSRGSSALDGMNRGGQSARASSARGNSSRGGGGRGGGGRGGGGRR
jgi:hypothetical protein